jgi:hypothetical protein
MYRLAANGRPELVFERPAALECRNGMAGIVNSGGDWITATEFER